MEAGELEDHHGMSSLEDLFNEDGNDTGITVIQVTMVTSLCCVCREVKQFTLHIIQNSLQYTPGDIVVKVYSLARTVAHTLRSNGLLFWTSGGTTLGQNQVRCW